MPLFYAHYPALENRFLEYVQTQRSNPLDKWLVVCASSFLAQHLQAALTAKQGALANMFFITAGSLITQLDQEVPGPALPLFPQDHLRDFLIKELLSEPGLNRYPVSHGFVQTVKSTLRDLADSLAEPDILEEHVRSLPDFVLQEDGGRLAWLIQLYRRYREKEAQIPGYRPYQHAFERALNQVEGSPFLQGFSHILIYGFYDMPGRQWELISRLKSAYPITVFVPYQKHPAYQFARAFFETNWLSKPGAEDVNQPTPSALGDSASFLFANQGSARAQGVDIISVPDSKGAVFFIAKEILRRLADGEPAGQMAVIARNITPYQDEIRRVFEENCLPLDASFTYPLAHYSLGVFLLQLLTLLQNGFERNLVLSVFSSPYFKPAQKNSWKRLLNRSAVSQDVSQWQDLLPLTRGYQPDVLDWLQQTVVQLKALSQPVAWQEGVQLALTFLASQTDTTAFEGKDAEIYQAVQDSLAQINTYAAIRPQAREGELLQEITAALSALTFNEVQHIRGGITVTDALRARGLSFQTVFLLGLNDKEFPQVTCEDPILRDYYRFTLRNTLGYWINGSLERIDEEKLLFYNAVTAARTRLYALVSRRGEDGKPAIPSIYAAELARVCGLDLAATDAPRISGRLSERLAACETRWLTPQELSTLICLQPGSAVAHLKHAGLLTAAKEQSLTAAYALCAIGPLGAYDGIIQSGRELFDRAQQRGFSPSALQELGACPFKYFMNRGLGLGEPDEPLSRQELPANTRGTAYHEILKLFYQHLADQKLTRELFAAGAAEYIRQTVRHYYPADSYKRFGIYPIVWELIVENMFSKLTDFVTQDLATLGAFVPSYFEVEVSEEPTPQLPLRLHGYVDRIDIDPAAKQFCIADYKSSRKLPTDLSEALFTDLIFQPFLYGLLAQQLPALNGYAYSGSYLLSVSKYAKRMLTDGEWQAQRPAAQAFFTRLAGLIKQGTLFICPSQLCAYCPYAMLCRKDAFHPLLRAQKSVQVHALQEARRVC